MTILCPFAIATAGVVALVAALHELERRSPERRAWRIGYMGHRRSFPLRIQLVIFLIVLAGVVAAVAWLNHRGLM